MPALLSRRAGAVWLVTIAATGIACQRDEPVSETTAPVVVTVSAARRIDMVDTLTASGVIVTATSAEQIVNAPEPAQVAEAPKQMGDTVAAGDLLVRFDIPAVTQEVAARQTEIADATARVDRTRRELATTTTLSERGLVARQDLDKAKSAVVDAQLAFTEARARLDAALLMQRRTIVNARIAGIVAEKWHTEGDFVRGGSDDPVIKIIDPTRTQVAVTLSQAELLRVTAGRPAMIRTPTGEEVPGLVSTRPAMPDPTAPTAEVRVSFQTPSPLPLETPVQVVIELDLRPGATVVPRAAVLRDEESSYVYIAGDDGRAHRRAVQTGLLTSDLAQIMTGVAPGETVIVTGLDQLADGATITINR